jgi:hypothetical protein
MITGDLFIFTLQIIIDNILSVSIIFMFFSKKTIF